MSLIHDYKEQRFFINYLVANLSSSGNKNWPKQAYALYSLSHMALISMNSSVEVLIFINTYIPPFPTQDLSQIPLKVT